MEYSWIRSVVAVPVLWLCFNYILSLAGLFAFGGLPWGIIPTLLLSALALVVAVAVVLRTDVRVSAVVVTALGAGTLGSVVLRSELLPHFEGLPILEAFVGLVIYALLFVPAYAFYRGLAAGTARAVERVRAE